MEENFKVLGRRVKALRIEKGISQSRMAKLLGLSQTNLSNMESGRTAITTQNIFKMQSILNCKIADIFVDFDGKFDDASENKDEQPAKQALELEDAVKILKLLRAVDVKGI